MQRQRFMKPSISDSFAYCTIGNACKDTLAETPNSVTELKDTGRMSSSPSSSMQITRVYGIPSGDQRLNLAYVHVLEKGRNLVNVRQAKGPAKAASQSQVLGHS